MVKGEWQSDSLHFQLLKTAEQRNTSLNNNSVACLLPDPAEPGKRLWIGTKGGGINCLDLQTGRVNYLTTTEGLPNNVVYAILPDGRGHFWCSTNRGLVRLSVQGATVSHIKLFTIADGLQSNEFNTQAFFKAPDGELLFGGVNGLNRFFPESLELNKQPPPVYIIGMEINHQAKQFSISGGTPLEYLDKIILEADQNNLSLEFAALDFTDPAKNRYRYQLLPIEKNWVEAGEKHFAHYTHLAPGEYIFRVQGSNNDGAWNETPVEIRVVVQPPWWQSRLAWIVYFSILAGIIWRVYLAQTRSIRLREQIAFEHRESKRVRELEQMKTNFFSNITHEFRTPLTLIIEPLRQVLKNPNADNWLVKVQLAARNSHKLLQLVNELLDLAKLESGAMQTEYRSGYVGDMLRPIVESFAGAAESKDVSIHLSIPENDIRGAFDTDKIEKICFNLLSNALKFTPPGGKIQVSVLRTSGNSEMPPFHNNTGNWFMISVKDNGKGIAKADLPYIFDRFYQADDTPERGQIGTGIGLALCRELAELMGGKITAESKPGQGADFQLRLPLIHSATNGTAAPTPDHKHENQPVDDHQNIQPATGIHAGDSRQEERPADETSRPLLLLAEDNDELRAFISQTLSDVYDVIQASDGRQAIELARQRVPDIVVSDIFMPHLDGIGLLVALKKDVITSHIPVLLLTSKTAFESRLEGLQQGADAYLGKPFQTEELLAWLDNLLETRRRIQEKYSRQASANGNGQPNRPDVLEIEVPSPGAVMSVLDRRFLEKLQQIVEQEIENENLSVEDVARNMAMSRSQLHRKLSAITGQSAGEFLRNYRLDRAMELLRAKAGNVSEVAWSVGFSNPKYFSTSFKERFGISPSEV
jgi:signal transduction histidine kinase/DNA-binding response OmpR family regulator